jgi:hypothetical protein
MRRLILIPCSNSKRHGGTADWNRRDTAAARLGPCDGPLMAARAEIGRLLGEQPAADLGSAGTLPPLLPAIDRYCGRFYDGSGLRGWTGQALDALTTDCFIVSGLYGLLTPREPIRYYDCWMDKTLNGVRVKGGSSGTCASTACANTAHENANEP